MCGKYSPTVTVAYRTDQKWFINYCFHKINSSDWAQYDPEGFDSYGYNENNIDRAGNHENDYDINDEDYDTAHDIAFDDWGFDGTKPVQRNT